MGETMKILRYGIAITTCLLLSACDESYEGQLSLQQPITLKMKKDADLVVPMGSMPAKIKASSDKVKLKLTVDGKEREVSFKLPKGVKIRSFNDVNILPEASGQPYALRGSENTDYNDSMPMRGTESCSYNTSERECGYETTPRTCHNEQTCHLTPAGQQCTSVPVCSGGETRYVCRDRTITHYGSKEVEYYVTYSTTSRQVNIIDPASQQVVGNFSNTSHDSNKHYTHQGPCYADGGWRP